MLFSSLPILIRLVVCFISGGQLFDPKDLLFMGLTLSIANVNILANLKLDHVESQVERYKHVSLSVVAIIFISVLLGLIFPLETVFFDLIWYKLVTILVLSILTVGMVVFVTYRSKEYVKPMLGNE